MTIKEVSERYGISQDTLRYYERSGMIPAVGRTAGGIRDYGEEDLGWVELALCMRSAGLPVEAMARYVELCLQGDATIPDRLRLLMDQRRTLIEQEEQIRVMLKRLDYKIFRYEEAVRTGKLTWEEPEKEDGLMEFESKQERKREYDL
ncbi:MAG: MerR family transcriptional regulator [Acetatifactor sp.]|nr:MerR family transcriptional regulator [Acetatifactor sp.]MDE7353455.1 MerR family transcriptional regulator [Acetatifactor sp.]